MKSTNDMRLSDGNKATDEGVVGGGDGATAEGGGAVGVGGRIMSFLRTPQGKVAGLCLSTAAITLSLLLLNTRLMFAKAGEGTMRLSLSKPVVEMELARWSADSDAQVDLSVLVSHDSGVQIPQEIPVTVSLCDEEGKVVKEAQMPVTYDDLTCFPCFASTSLTLTKDECDAVVTAKATVDDGHIEIDTTTMDDSMLREMTEEKKELSESRKAAEAAKEDSVAEAPAPEDEAKAEQVPRFSDTDFSDTFVIGDSVLALSAREGGYGDKIAENLPGADYDVESGRYFESDVSGDPGDGMIDIARRVAGDYDRYVIECGINDAGLTRAMANEFIDVLQRDGTQIFFVNQRVIGGADDVTCSTIREVAEDNERVYEIDWNSLCSGNEGEWLVDVCHPNATGAERLTSLIRDVVAEHAGDLTVPAEGDGHEKDGNDKTDAGKADPAAEAEALAWEDSSDMDRADLRISTETEISAWASRIDDYLAGTELAGYGRLFAECAATYQVDPRLSPAISTIESGCGAICAAPHNAWGWGGPGNWASWSSWEEAIEGHVSGLARNGYASMGAEECAMYCDWSYWDGNPDFCLKTEVLKI